MPELRRMVERIRGDDGPFALRVEPDDLMTGRVAGGMVQLDPGREVDVPFHVRISYATGDERLHRGMEILVKIAKA
jgi:hypothetical protein